MVALSGIAIIVTNYKRVQVLQNKAIRIIGKYVEKVHRTNACYKSLNLLNVGKIKDFQASIYILSVYE